MIYEIIIQARPVVIRVDTISGKDVAEELARRAYQKLGPLWMVDDSEAIITVVGLSGNNKGVEVIKRGI